MTKLSYVGFNGYCQCPINKDGLPKVITDWTTSRQDDEVKVCTHRFVVVEEKKFFKIYGVLNEVSTKQIQVITKPVKTDNLGSCDEYLIASKGTNIWKCNFSNLEWVECKLEFLSEEDKSIWDDPENRILKFSFQTSDVILLLSNGSVWVLSKENKLRLIYPQDLEKAVKISSGLEHTLILTESGCVLAFGNGSRGQLGHGDLSPTMHPVQIPALEGLKVINIACGGWHSCAIIDSGDLYTWGWNNYGQLSAFENKEEISLTASPTFVEVGEEPDMKVVDVACGRRHTVALLENGDLYSTGWNAYNQLGISSSLDKVMKFTKCQIDSSQNRKVICGPWYTILIVSPN